MLQTCPVLISRRNLLLAAVATSVAACSSKRELGQPVDNPASPVDAAGVPVLAKPDPARVPASLVMVGDSISALSEDALHAVITDMGFGTVTINAEPGRRIEVGRTNPTNGLDVVTFIAGADRPGMWVIGLGTNDAGGYATDEEYKGLIVSLLEVIGGDVPLVWVNAYRKDNPAGCRQFNKVLDETLKDRGNTSVADWYQLCVDKGSEVLTDDGVHPNTNGILAFANIVRSAIVTCLG